MKDFETCRTLFIERVLEYIDGRSILSVSKILGIPERTINGWITGGKVPGMESLVLLAQKMKCSLDYLVGLED